MACPSFENLPSPNIVSRDLTNTNTLRFVTWSEDVHCETACFCSMPVGTMICVCVLIQNIGCLSNDLCPRARICIKSPLLPPSLLLHVVAAPSPTRTCPCLQTSLTLLKWSLPLFWKSRYQVSALTSSSRPNALILWTHQIISCFEKTILWAHMLWRPYCAKISWTCFPTRNAWTPSIWSLASAILRPTKLSLWRTPRFVLLHRAQILKFSFIESMKPLAHVGVVSSPFAWTTVFTRFQKMLSNLSHEAGIFPAGL